MLLLLEKAGAGGETAERGQAFWNFERLDQHHGIFNAFFKKMGHEGERKKIKKKTQIITLKKKVKSDLQSIYCIYM